MDVSANRPARTAGPGVQPDPSGIRRSPWRRRPSGQPPPLPHHLQTGLEVDPRASTPCRSVLGTEHLLGAAHTQSSLTFGQDVTLYAA